MTNTEFRRFVDATGYVTLAERPADPADYPGAKPEMLVPSSVMFRKAAGSGRSRQLLQLVDYVAGCGLAPSARSREFAARVCGTIRSCTSRSRMQKPMRNGRARNCRPRPSGSSRRAVGSTAPNSCGVPNSRRTVATWPTHGRVNSRGRTCWRMDMNGRRRWARSHRTATGCTRWPATSGNGPPTGTRITARSGRRAARSTIRAAAIPIRATIRARPTYAFHAG